MKFSDLKKHFLLLMLSFGIVSGSYAFVTNSDLSSVTTKKSFSFQSLPHQSLPSITVCDFVETDNDDESDSHHHLQFLDAATANQFIFLLAQKEILLVSNHYSLPFVANQKLNVLNCTFLI